MSGRDFRSLISLYGNTRRSKKAEDGNFRPSPPLLYCLVSQRKACCVAFSFSAPAFLFVVPTICAGPVICLLLGGCANAAALCLLYFFLFPSLPHEK